MSVFVFRTSEPLHRYITEGLKHILGHVFNKKSDSMYIHKESTRKDLQSRNISKHPFIVSAFRISSRMVSINVVGFIVIYRVIIFWIICIWTIWCIMTCGKKAEIKNQLSWIVLFQIAFFLVTNVYSVLKFCEDVIISHFLRIGIDPLPDDNDVIVNIGHVFFKLQVFGHF